jgi:hypothetical protein
MVPAFDIFRLVYWTNPVWNRSIPGGGNNRGNTSSRDETIGIYWS